MRLAILYVAVFALSFSGCGEPKQDEKAGGSDPSNVSGEGFALSGDNTKVQFVGTHVGEKPDPRTGKFTDLTGNIGIDSDTRSVKSIFVEIETASLTTDIEKLTNHLKNTDFFDVRQFPKATFESTSVTAGNGDEVTIEGNLTLLGVTKEISFPATVKITDGNVTLNSNFTIDRTRFGMDYGLDQVEKDVAMTISVGS